MSRLWPALLALLLAGCARETPVVARPALWVVRDADTTVYLLGTVHALPPNVEWHTPIVRAAIARSDALALELPDAPWDTQAAFEAASRAPDLPPLAARLPAAWRPYLDVAIGRTGADVQDLDRRTTWAAAAILAAAAARQEGADAGYGVDTVLATEFRSADKPRHGLETAAEQFAAFATLDEVAQRSLLVATIRGVLGQPDYRATVAAWERGDVAALAAMARAGLAGPPELAAQLLDQRNTRFADAVAARMRTPGTLLVAIGAGHLAGPGSVVALLEQRGLRVRRVE